MTTPSELGTTKGTLAEVLEKIAALGNIPPERIRMSPPPGTATEADVIAERQGPQRRLCELIDGILVEKPMSTPESLVAAQILRRIANHIDEEDLGAVFGEAGMLRLEPGLVRIPDVSFVPWKNVPGGKIDPYQPIAALVPDLAVEVISKSNTPAEIDRKLKEYFFHGTRLAWVIDPRKQTAKVYTAPDAFKRVTKTGSLDAAPVLPGFKVSLPDVFSRLSQRKRTG
jgi:Uma2 family endonuclease